MRPGRRVWWAALLLMLFLPSSTWKRGGTDRYPVRVTVHEAHTIRPQLVSDLVAPQRATQRKAARRARKMRVPGLSQTD